MKSSSVLIPYERQEDPLKCGAASLCMVYRGYGRSETQTDVWPKISSEKWCARTHLIAKDAIDRGLQAIVIQSSDRWRSLRRCQQLHVPAILNHRFDPASARGHYSVFLTTLGDRAMLHDPFFGPGRTLSRKELDEIWGWQPLSQEVAGDILVPISPEKHPLGKCRECGQAFPEKVTCPNCHAEVPLGLASALGCADRNCENSLWRRIFCPSCDTALIGLDGQADLLESPAETKTKIRHIVDMIKEQTLMAAELAPDDPTRQALMSMADHCEKLGPDIEDMMRQTQDDLNDAVKTLDNVDKKRDDAKQKVMAKKAARAKARADKLAARLKLKEEKLAPPTLDDEALRVDVLQRFGLPAGAIETSL